MNSLVMYARDFCETSESHFVWKLSQRARRFRRHHVDCLPNWYMGIPRRSAAHFQPRPYLSCSPSSSAAHIPATVCICIVLTPMSSQEEHDSDARGTKKSSKKRRIGRACDLCRQKKGAVAYYSALSLEYIDVSCSSPV